MSDRSSSHNSRRNGANGANHSGPHARYQDFIRPSTEESQERRRHSWLEELRMRREETMMLRRGILEEEIEEEHPPYEEFQEFDETEPDLSEYEDYGLMQGEWLSEVPNDIRDNWLSKICPKGTRALVIAEKGRTFALGRNREVLFFNFPSWLPGGSSLTQRGKTVLDTIFVESRSTFYVLDVIHWGIDTTDFEAELRFFWLRSKIDETPVLNQSLCTNHYKFINLDGLTFPMLQEKMLLFPAFADNLPEVDGIIFFHKESNYVNKRSPLVIWLTTYMLHTMLNVGVAQEYLNVREARGHI